jgi:GDP-fucose protein O-fucosyltransferase
MKRFVRDHVRFVDEIQCAAARVVQQIRERVRERTGDPAGTFDTMHVRRGDFQYKLTRVTAEDIYQQTSKKLPENGTVFIATDERDKSFFEPLRAHYDVLFLDDFHDALGAQLNSNYFGTLH